MGPNTGMGHQPLWYRGTCRPPCRREVSTLGHHICDLEAAGVRILADPPFTDVWLYFVPARQPARRGEANLTVQLWPTMEL